MKKRLLATMPHVPLLELRPELQEQEDAQGDPDDPQDTMDNVEVDTQGIDEANAAEMEANITFHNFEEQVDAKYGVIQRIKRLIFRKNVNGRLNPAGRIRHWTAEDDDMRYGDDESSENEGDQHDRIPLVRRNKRK